ncbi:hypothetical protein TrispH2_010823 [Trichoplax sp. H2]|nr:hypothetical protein TrispH2_010823 [Trichoplax sp. H2]|eukprot:RDD36961.1 hypothetical protein TrispH2_010823 [Trichoplax sp. H2]
MMEDKVMLSNPQQQIERPIHYIHFSHWIELEASVGVIGKELMMLPMHFAPQLVDTKVDDVDLEGAIKHQEWRKT